MSDDFGLDPDIPAVPTDTELNDFWLACAETMHGQPLTPVVIMLKAAISVTFSLRAEVERLRVALGQKPTSVADAQALLADFLEKAQNQ